MAKLRLSPLILEVHGKMGDLVFRRTRNGGMSIIKRADMSDVKWSKAQSTHRHRFREAIADAKQAMADPARKKAYEKAGLKTGRRAFEMAVSDYFKQQKEK